MDEIFILLRLNLSNNSWVFITSSSRLENIVAFMLDNGFDNEYQIMVNDFNHQNKPISFKEWCNKEEIK